MLVLNILFLLLGIVAFIIPSESGWRYILAFGAQVLILFSLGGYFLDLKRLYVYGLMLALAAPVGEWLYQTYKVPHHGYPVTYGLSALIIFLVGLAKFITLVRNNPLPPEDLSLLETNNG
jgi:hypothetical protein